MMIMMMMMQRPCLPLLFRSGKELAETAKHKTLKQALDSEAPARARLLLLHPRYG